MAPGHGRTGALGPAGRAPPSSSPRAPLCPWPQAQPAGPRGLWGLQSSELCPATLLPSLGSPRAPLPSLVTRSRARQRDCASGGATGKGRQDGFVTPGVTSSPATCETLKPHCPRPRATAARDPPPREQRWPGPSSCSGSGSVSDPGAFCQRPCPRITPAQERGVRSPRSVRRRRHSGEDTGCQQLLRGSKTGAGDPGDPRPPTPRRWP